MMLVSYQFEDVDSIMVINAENKINNLELKFWLTLCLLYTYALWNGLVWFLCLMAHQPWWVIWCQSHPYRTAVILFNPIAGGIKRFIPFLGPEVNVIVFTVILQSCTLVITLWRLLSLGNSVNPSPLLLAIGKIVGQTGLSSLAEQSL